MVQVPIPLILFHFPIYMLHHPILIDPGFETEDDTLSDSGSDSDKPDDLSSDNSFEQRLAKGRITIKSCLLGYVMYVL